MISEYMNPLDKLLNGFSKDDENKLSALERAKAVLNAEESAELEWAKFCLHPEIV